MQQDVGIGMEPAVNLPGQADWWPGCRGGCWGCLFGDAVRVLVRALVQSASGYGAIWIAPFRVRALDFPKASRAERYTTY